MAKVSFFLKKDEVSKGKHNTYPVYARFTHKSEREFFQTYVRLKETDIIYTEINGKKVIKDDRMKVRPQILNSQNLNIELEKLYMVAANIVHEFKQKPQRSFTAIDLKAAFENEVRPGGKDSNDWKALYLKFVETKKNANTRRSYIVTLHKVQEFLGAEKRTVRISGKKGIEYQGDRTYPLEDINPAFFDKVIDWMLDIKKYEPSYATDVYTDIRSFLKWVQKNKIAHINPESIIYEPSRELIDYPKPAIFLTRAEFKKLLEYEPPLPYLERAKDIFLLLCYTALRVSDRHIDVSEIVDNLVLKSNTKTDAFSRIPLLPEAQDILKKYDYKMPILSDQDLNRFIKELLKRAGIDAPTKIISYPGGVKTEKVIPKYEAISSKTGRKTLISRMIGANIHERKIRPITGHKRAINLEPYMGVENADIDQALRDAFKKE